MRNTYIIVVSVVFVIFLLMTLLAWHEHLQRDYSAGKDWWSVSFVNPLPSSEDYGVVIENFSEEGVFRVRGFDGEEIVYSEEVTVTNGARYILEFSDERVDRVTVGVGSDERTLYK